MSVHPPLVGRVAREAQRVRGSIHAARADGTPHPALRATRSHKGRRESEVTLLPQRRQQFVRRFGHDHVAGAGHDDVREFGVAAASVLPAFAGVIMSRSPRMNVAGTLTCAAAASAFW